MKILVLGATGMLGSMVMHILSESQNFEVYGTVRDARLNLDFRGIESKRLLICNNVLIMDELKKLFLKINPDVVINCIGLVKQLESVNDPLNAIPLNSLLPHQLARLTKEYGSRLIHISTDCVFSGSKGDYLESDLADARDLYGLSKFLGEVSLPHAITLRTSIIGHEIRTSHSLIDWFMAQDVRCLGYTRAIYSGLPTVTLASIIKDYVLPNPALNGLYHVSSDPISKYDLLKLVSKIYDKKIEIIPDDKLVIDRSLNSELFQGVTGYCPTSWEAMIHQMHNYRC